MENENEEEIIIDSQEENNEEVELEIEDKVEEEKPVETPEAKRARLKRQLEQHEKKFGFGEPKPVAKETSDNISSTDMFAILKADVHEDDVEKVTKFAKMEGISVKEALKNPELKAILNVRQEQRTTAVATNISNARRGAQALTGETLVENASKGKLPESDADIERLMRAKMGLK